MTNGPNLHPPNHCRHERPGHRRDPGESRAPPSRGAASENRGSKALEAMHCTKPSSLSCTSALICRAPGGLLGEGMSCETRASPAPQSPTKNNLLTRTSFEDLECLPLFPAKPSGHSGREAGVGERGGGKESLQSEVPLGDTLSPGLEDKKDAFYP